jgi:hypothetical protein
MPYNFCFALFSVISSARFEILRHFLNNKHINEVQCGEGLQVKGIRNMESGLFFVLEPLQTPQTSNLKLSNSVILPK